tara:strand:- start:8541 stop:9716 length:1176 start_codon:yes stop_codon:yes gene_type:complete
MSKLKTIKDAHEELNGDLNNTYHPMPNTDKGLFFSKDSRGYFCSSSLDNYLEDGSQYICSIEEFNNYKPQKTVWDAVNELRGDLNNTYMFDADDIYLFYCNDGSDYICSYSVEEGDDKKIVCSIDEFKALVEGMMNNFGDCSILEFEAYECADKAPLEKETKPDYTSLEFWKDAPEVATHYDKFTGDFCSCVGVLRDNKLNPFDFPMNMADSRYLKRPQSTQTETPKEKEALDSIVNTLTVGGNYEFSDDKENWEGGELVKISCSVPLTYQSKSGNKHEWYTFIRPIKQKENIYTQEMADNGELPSVGMEFMHQGAIATTISTSKEYGGVVTFTTYGGCSIGCCWFNDVWVKPIDTRTKKEKAIDEAYAKWSETAIELKELLIESYDEWVG